MMRPIPLLALLLLIPASALAASSDFDIHEWGTFTSLQDENGRTIGGINSDDEPVPPFVHNLAWQLLLGDANAQLMNRLVQGWPRAHNHVTMRLETPVLYVHAGDSADAKLDVSVEFRGGWLTQFYPEAEFVGPQSAGIKIDGDTRGRLTWKKLSLRHDNPPGPKTDAHVWTTPRNVDATTISTPKGETEKYLFYRGVGHVEAPLRVARDGEELRIDVQFDPQMPRRRPPTFTWLWYSDIQPDGRCAWRQVEGIDPNVAKTRVPAAFKEADYSKDNLAALRKSMHAALVAAGLYEDEATAMLDTWELSYFKSWGTRLFYIVPPAWTEYVLPLQVSPTPKEIVRVMVGRIDLVTPRHRELLAKISGARDAKKQDKELWQAYDQLGRFRNALVLDEQKRRPSVPLGAFIDAHGLEGFGE